MRIFNERIDLKYTKNYASEENAVKALQKAHDKLGIDKNTKVLIVVKEGRFVPITFLVDHNGVALAYMSFMIM